ncbi:MAG: O-antigen ligase, partial [Clostridia bacterium]|nr:O-antigen ligase [Clostridia bacterium]
SPAMFTIGFIFAIDKNHTNLKDNIIYSYSKQTVYIIILSVIIISSVYFHFIFSRIQSYYSINIWYTLRSIVWFEETKEIPLFNYPAIPIFLIPTILIFCFRKNPKSYFKYSAILISIIALIWSLLSTSRTTTFTFITVTLMSQIIYGLNNNLMLSKAKRMTKRWIFISIILVLIVFIGVSMQKNPTAYGEVNKITFALKSLVNYTNLSSVAFVEWYKGGFELRNGLNSFRLFYVVLQQFGLNVEVVNTTSGGLFINYNGFSSNAFTVARNYIEDFGIIYMSIILMLFGWIHGKAYKNALFSIGKKKIRYSIICGFLYVPLLYQILTDQYLNVISQWIQYVFWTYVLTYILLPKKIIKLSNRQ